MEFELNGHQYKTTPMDAFTQFHVARRLIPALLAFAKAGDEEELGDILEPVVLEVCKMTDADSNLVLNACLSSVFRKDTDKWVKLKSADSAFLQYQDVTLVELLRITILVVKENLGDFFAVAPSLMAGQDQA